MMQHVLERGLHRDPIFLVHVRVHAGADDLDFHGAARNGRRLAWGDEFGAAHRNMIAPFAFASCESV